MLQNFINRFKENKHEAIKERANEIFQLCEYDGEMWLTFNGNLILPTSCLKDDPLATLAHIRELFVKRECK